MTSRGKQGGFQKGETTPRPEWALAYILQDWKRTRAVRKAYDAIGAHGAEDARAQELLHEALRKMRVYAAALEEVSP